VRDAQGFPVLDEVGRPLMSARVDRTTVMQVAAGALGLFPGQTKPQDQRIIAKSLLRLGFESRRETFGRWYVRRT
jgi:hypothetical protein